MGEEKMRSWIVRIVAAAAAAWPLAAMAQSADMVLVNGKIITVDDQFTIAQALAIRGERIIAVGSNEAVRELAGDGAKVVDLKGRTVMPGLIDNHAHFMRSAEYWDREVRLDGIASRSQALDMIRQKAASSRPGEWVLVLGGWYEGQFDDTRPFAKAELDAAAPNNPVVLQVSYERIYANTLGLKALKVGADTPDPPRGKIDKDSSGQPTGVFHGGGAVGMTLARLGHVEPARLAANVPLLMHDLNAVGLTAWHDMGGRMFGERHIEAFRTAWKNRQMTLRVFYTFWQDPMTPEQVDKALANIPNMKPFQGDDWFDVTSYGETLYFKVHDSAMSKGAPPSAEDMALWRKMAESLADHHLHLVVHSHLRFSTDAFLTQLEEMSKERPIKALHWTLTHADQITEHDIDRLKRLGMNVQMHSSHTVENAMIREAQGERAADMPPMRMVQNSGLAWGLGTDATAVAPSNPFYTLWWAVTGKMLGGKVVLKQTVTREQALIAHTRSNAPFLFEEANIGSLAPGKYADLLVIDRDYLTVPADEIKDIHPLITMVGGKIVYRADNTVVSDADAK
jgi:hypothetical protein